MLTTLAGVLLLLVLAADVFGTVFLERGGFLHNTQNTVVWSGLRKLGFALPGNRRASILALGGPILAVLTIASWVLLLVVAFALIYAPHLPNFTYTGGARTILWVEALYFSAVVSSTLGFGDVVAASPALRLLTGMHGLLGLALFGVAVTYVLSVYSQSTRARALALAIGAYLEAGVDEAIRREGVDSVTEWTQDVAMRLLHILQAHQEYPILHYFISRGPDSSLPYQVGRLLGLVERLEAEEAGDGEARGRRPSSTLLRRAVERYIAQAERRFIPSHFMRHAKLEERTPQDAYDRLMRYLGFSEDQEPSEAP